MAQIKLDLGVQEYEIGSGLLRFNPTDPNLYHRFLQAADEIERLEGELAASAEAAKSGKETLELLNTADQRAKELLSQCFGGGNDFEQVLGGVNLLAVCKNGQRAVTNLLTALQPVLEEGAKGFYESAAAPQLAEAEAARRARGEE